MPARTARPCIFLPGTCRDEPRADLPHSIRRRLRLPHPPSSVYTACMHDLHYRSGQKSRVSMLRFAPGLRSGAVLLACALSGPHASPAAALTASADFNAGYGAKVMEKVLQHWTRPTGAKGLSIVIVRLTGEGRPFSCEISVSSGDALVDDAICAAVAKAGNFPPPPNGAPAEVAISFSYDDTGLPAGAVEAPLPRKSYADIIKENAYPHFTMPEGIPQGEYNAVARLMIRQDGSLAACQMEQSSGIPQLDSAIMRALLQPGVITPPPDGHAANVSLPFVIRAR